MQALVFAKNRRPKFELTLRISDLNNVPLVSGTSFVKWHLPRPAGADQHGRTAKCRIRDHKIPYDYSTTVAVQLTVDKTGVLHDHFIHLEVVQEYGGGAKGERITLGNVKLNLAEYCDETPDGVVPEDPESYSRRYLMQDSRINSTLKLGIHMRLVEGERNFATPKSHAAPVFGAIAGIVSGEQTERDDGTAMPSTSNKARETGETQDLYRQNLAAYWSAQPGELRADECIENIFAGGDGWGSASGASAAAGAGLHHNNGNHGAHANTLSPSMALDDHHHHHSHNNNNRGSFDAGRNESRTRWSSSSSHRRTTSRDSDRSSGGGGGGGSILVDGGAGGGVVVAGGVGGGGSGSSTAGRSMLGVGGRSSLEQKAKEMKAEATNAPDGWPREAAEVNEFDVREDLRAWKISPERLLSL